MSRFVDVCIPLPYGYELVSFGAIKQPDEEVLRLANMVAENYHQRMLGTEPDQWHYADAELLQHNYVVRPRPVWSNPPYARQNPAGIWTHGGKIPEQPMKTYEVHMKAQTVSHIEATTAKEAAEIASTMPYDSCDFDWEVTEVRNYATGEVES